VLVTTAADGRLLINALLADLTDFESPEDLLGRDLLLVVSADATSSHAAIGNLARADDGSADLVMNWRGAGGARMQTPVSHELTDSDIPLAAGKVKVRLTAKLKNPPEVNIEIEFSKTKVGESPTGFARFVTPLPNLPTPVGGGGLPARLATWRAQLLEACCSASPRPLRSGDLAVATRSDLTALAVVYAAEPEDLDGQDVVLLLLDHRDKGSEARACEGEAGSIGCRPLSQPLLNLRLAAPNAGSNVWRVLLSDPSDPSAVFPEAIASVSEAPAMMPSATTIDVDHLPTGIVIIITVKVRNVVIEIRINL
jgi:hypothetical protein